MILSADLDSAGLNYQNKITFIKITENFFLNVHRCYQTTLVKDKWLKSKHHVSPNNSSIEKSTLIEQPSANIEKTKTNYFSIKKRKYNECYLQYGFNYTYINNKHRPMCLICNGNWASESMKPIKLKRHLTTRHASYAEKPLVYFERLF